MIKEELKVKQKAWSMARNVDKEPTCSQPKDLVKYRKTGAKWRDNEMKKMAS